MRGPYLVSGNLWKYDANPNYGVGPYFYDDACFIPLVFDTGVTRKVVVAASDNESTWTEHVVYTHNSTTGPFAAIACSRSGDILYLQFYSNSGSDLVVAVATFDLTTRTAGSPILRSGGPPFSPAIGSAKHTSETISSSPQRIQFQIDRAEAHFQIFATGTDAWRAIMQSDKNGTSGEGAALSYQDYAGSWSGGASSTLFGHGNGRPSDLACGGVYAGGRAHQFFIDGIGELYHQSIGVGSVQDIAFVKYPGDTPNSGGITYNRTQCVTGAPIYDSASNSLVMPFVDSSNRVAVAYGTEAASPTWTVEVVDATVTPYTAYQGGTTPQFEAPTPVAVAVIAGEWNVFWLDDANQRGAASGRGNANMQSIWRSRRVSGSWTAPVVYYQEETWINAVDVAVEGPRFAVLMQFAGAGVVPYIIFDEPAAGGQILMPSLTTSTLFGPFSGLTGGIPGGAGCGTGKPLPSSSGVILPRCSTYTAV